MHMQETGYVTSKTTSLLWPSGLWHYKVMG